MRFSEYLEKAHLPQSADWQQHVELGKTPFNHQIDDLRFMGNHLRSGIFNEPGVGKTLPIQGYALWLCGNKNKVVVIMPPVLIPQFSRTIKQNYKGIEGYVKCAAFNGSPAERDKQWHEWEVLGFPDVLLMTYIGFVKYHEDLLKKGYNCVIVDEATAIKSPTSKIHKAVRRFSDDNNGVVLVTGTPVETNVEDCYGFVKILTPDVYGSYKHFETRHVVKDSFWNPKTDTDIYKTVGYVNMDQLHHNLYLSARRVLKSEVSDLPPRLVTEYLVDLSKPHQNLYNMMVNDRMLEIGDELIDMTTQQALYQGMQQALLNPEKYGKEIKENALFETLDEIIAELDGQKILVYAWFNHSVEAICERYKHLNPSKVNGSVTGRSREEQIVKFCTEPETKMLVANPKSGGVGIDGLQHVCSHVVYAEVCPFVGTFQQSVDRLHRTGQKAEAVNVYVLVAKDTIAIKLRNNLIKKDSDQEAIMKDKRAILADLQGAEGICGSLDEI